VCYSLWYNAPTLLPALILCMVPFNVVFAPILCVVPKLGFLFTVLEIQSVPHGKHCLGCNNQTALGREIIAVSPHIHTKPSVHSVGRTLNC